MMKITRVLPVFLGIVMLAVLVAVQPAAAAPAAASFPEIIPLPNGFRPEGVVTGRGATLYAGSLANGAIYEVDLRTGEGEILVEGVAGKVAVGLGFDRRSNHLFVSGGPGGTATVYDGHSGTLLAEYQLTSPTTSPFINDVIVTRDAAYFTNSFAPEIYRLPLGHGGHLPPGTAVETIPLGGEFDFIPSAFNANGIEASANGNHLIIVNSTTASLYRVDPETGDAVLIDLGGASVPNGDGLVLVGNTLYVVQNRLNQIAVFKMGHHFTSGTLTKTITDPAFRVPTTAARFGRHLYAVNARFGTPATPDTEYEIVQVHR